MPEHTHEQGRTHEQGHIHDPSPADRVGTRRRFSLDGLRQRWWGVLLLVTAAVCIVWLAMTDRLGLYVHPRYFVFTVIMAGIAVVLGLFSVLVNVPAETEPPRRGRAVLATLSVIGSLAIVTAMVVLPPATLSVATADQRQVNSGTLSGTVDGKDAQAVLTANPDFSTFGIKDWATLLRQTTRPADLVGKPFSGTGFIISDPDDADVFFISRFVVNCCAVDAQPVGVPVHQPGWEKQFAAGAWVQVTGTIADGADSAHTLQVNQPKVDGIPEPSDPYEY